MSKGFLGEYCDVTRGLCYCDVEVWNGFSNCITTKEGVDLVDAYGDIATYKKDAYIEVARRGVDCMVYAMVKLNPDLDMVERICYFRNCVVSREELSVLRDNYEWCDILYIDNSVEGELCKQLLAEEKSKRIVPITLKEANEFVINNHRHHDSVTGCKFAIGLKKTLADGTDELVGVAICGRPVSRMLDDGLTLEINRLCVTDGRNCCSMLYSACVSVAKAMGYVKIITYILESESGISLKASSFTLESECCGGKSWSGDRENKHGKIPPEEYKQRWVRYLN